MLDALSSFAAQLALTAQQTQETFSTSLHRSGEQLPQMEALYIYINVSHFHDSTLCAKLAVHAVSMKNQCHSAGLMFLVLLLSTSALQCLGFSGADPCPWKSQLLIL
eukprot:scaffold256965_cov19-Tisochrysis_lutea.AAC.1